MSYLPFRGLSAWFSTSVHPTAWRKWEKYGGIFAPETEAEFLFSDDAFARDTWRVHNEQVDVVVFLSGWVTEVVEKRSRVHDVPVGKYCLHPCFMIQQQQMPGDPYTTPQRSLPSSNDTAGPRRSGHETEMGWVNSRKQAVVSDHRQQGEQDGGVEAGNQCGSCLPKDPNGNSVGVGFQVPGSSQGGGRESRKFSPLVDTGAMWEPLYALMETLPEEDIRHVDEVQILALPLFDFVPQLPEFVMKRKHSM